MKIEKIIVTGGLGFIGSNLIDLLIKKKFKVINIDKVSYSSNFYNVKEHKGSKYFILIVYIYLTKLIIFTTFMFFNIIKIR